MYCVCVFLLIYTGKHVKASIRSNGNKMVNITYVQKKGYPIGYTHSIHYTYMISMYLTFNFILDFTLHLMFYGWFKHCVFIHLCTKVEHCNVNCIPIIVVITFHCSKYIQDFFCLTFCTVLQ